MPQNSYIGLDGVHRTKAEEDKVSMNIAALFSEPTGQAVLKYLRSVTIEMVGGPEISDATLRHFEGQRHIVGLIERHVQRGHKIK